MRPDEEGFLYPSIDMEKCVDCGLCERTCPILNGSEETPFYQEGYVVQARDCDVLEDSTSGGAFSLLAKSVLGKGGIVYGVGFDEGGFPVHKCASDVKNLAEFRGSKYVQSVPGDTYRRIKAELDVGRTVMYSGTPCQVEGLLAFLSTKPVNLITVDLVCHAVPSPLVYKRYLEYVGVPGFVRFRDKKPYGYQYSQITFRDNAGDALYMSGVESDPYLRAFFTDLSVRPSCYACHFKKRYRPSDFTLWDCWNAWAFSKDFDSDLGTTKVICHSKSARKMLSTIADKALIKQVDVDRLVAGEKEMFESVSIPSNRDAFFRDCREIEDASVLFSKWFPVSGKRKAERILRRVLSRLGMLGLLKNTAKGIKKCLP